MPAHTAPSFDPRPRFSPTSDPISSDATYIGLGPDGAIRSVSYSNTPPPTRSGARLQWFPARLVNLGDVGR